MQRLARAEINEKEDGVSEEEMTKRYQDMKIPKLKEDIIKPAPSSSNTQQKDNSKKRKRSKKQSSNQVSKKKIKAEIPSELSFIKPPE